MKSGWSFAALTGAVAVGMIMLPALAPGDSEKELKPNGKGIGTLFNPGNGNGNAGQAKGKPGGGGTTSNGISYHGGPVMTGTVNVYYIWYGSWNADSAMPLLQALASSIGSSPYFHINSTYSPSGQTIAGAVVLKAETTVSAPLNTTLTDANIQTIVTNAISSGALPKDTNGAYFVLTSKDVSESSGFCTQYCGWHTYGTIIGSNIKYAFVGNADKCPTACSAQSTSPNGNVGADAMASVIAHELEEMVTDPNLNAWYDTRGYENADKCAWTFGSTSTATNGSNYNMELGGFKFLIQQNWVNASGGFCAKSY